MNIDADGRKLSVCSEGDYSDYDETVEIDRVEMTLSDPEKENIVIGKIEWNGEEQKETQTKEYAYQKLKEQLIRYYQLSEEQLDIVYQG